MTTTHELVGTHGRLTLQAAGGMIGPARFDVLGAGTISPLTCPNWRDRSGANDWLPLIRNLCGDFVCLPYGAPEPSDALPDQWRGGARDNMAEDSWFHGHAVNHDWQIESGGDAASATMLCRPPAPHPIAEIRRRVTLMDDRAGYTAELTITARSDVALPISLHPCFALPDEPGALELTVPGAGRGWTYPVPVIPENAPVAVDARFDALSTVSRADGGMMNLSRLPPDERCEILLQMPAPAGEVMLTYRTAGYRVRFAYDAALLPTLVVWISNRGRKEAPFDGAFRTLGIEAVAGAFDLGPAVSRWPGNPVAAEGLATTITIEGGQDLTTTSSVILEPLDA